MKLGESSLRFPAPRAAALGLLSSGLLSHLALAMPYATSLTNNAGVVSFRLNQTTATNDTVLVISSEGTVTNVLQLASADPANVVSRGLVTTNLGIAAGTFRVQINHLGTGQPATNSPVIAISGPRGVAVNKNPASPYFGWVYASKAGKGLYAYSADLSDVTGQGTTAKTGGYAPFANTTGSSTSWVPYKVSVGPDDSVIVCDDTDTTGNLIALDPLLNSYQYVLKPWTGVNGAGGTGAAAPVGTDNNHGSLASAIIVGSGANRVLYTIDEDYQTDPASTINSEWNSLWKYDIGASAFPWSNAPVMKLMTPYIRSFAGQNQQVVTGPSGYLYVYQRRANPGQWGIYIVDPANPMDPASYAGMQGGYMWNSQDQSLAEGWPDDLMRDVNGIAVSPDGRYLAAMYYEDLTPQTNSVSGAVWAARANDVVIIPLTNGIPNFPQRTLFRGFGLTVAGRGIDFDAANNLYGVSSGMVLLQSVDLGESGSTTTDSGGTFTMVVPSASVSVQASTPVAYEQGTVPGVFTLTRATSGPLSPLTVFYTLSGTASNGLDYIRLTNQVTFADGVTSVNVTVTPIDDAIPELTETVTLSLATGSSYNVGIPGEATVAIVDNEPPQLRLASVSPSFFEANPYDYAAVVLRRYGDTNTQFSVDTANLSLGGTARSGVDYYLTNLPVSFDPGIVDMPLQLLYPIDNAQVDGARTITVDLLPGTGFSVATNTATVSIIDDDVPAETVLWSDNFDSDTSANWIVRFANLAGVDDYTATFNYDYSSLGIPPAPHSGTDTHGVFLTVNKGGLTSAAGVNLYPRNQSFSGDFALRFDMFLIMGSGSYTTEYALLGINHSGNQVNWLRNSGNGFTNSTYDGLWAYIEADGASLGNNNSVLADYVLNTAPAVDDVGTWGPTVLAYRTADTLSEVFKAPPWTIGAGYSGVPSNPSGSPTPSWAQVELSQINGIVTLKINNVPILSYKNSTAFTSGDIMLGYDDPYDSNGPSSSSVIYDNVRVVRVGGLQITGISLSGGNAQIDFTWGQNDAPSAFKLQTATKVTGPYVDDPSATITVLTPAKSYRAVTTVNGAGPVQFYRIRHL